MFLFFRYFRYFGFFFLCLSRPSCPARILPDSLTVITTIDTHNATWHDFARFVDAGKGSELTGMSELKKYFHRFGYLPAVAGLGNFTDIFDTQFESAVFTYQKNLGLPVTGKLDSDTISTIISPRCGVSDAIATGNNETTLFFTRSNKTAPSPHTTRHFQYFSGKPRWSRPTPVKLTYAFSSGNTIQSISPDEIKAVFARAFSRWASVIPVSFAEAEDYKTADIKIGFYGGDHGDGQPFDGVLGVLGHAFSPENGRLHLDRAETWAVDFGEEKSKAAVDLESVATHEIGHVLGLGHSSEKEAVMYPSLRPRRKKAALTVDDVEGVQALYGSNPNFRLSSLMESEDSSNNMGIGLTSGGLKWTNVGFTVGVLMLFLLT